MIFRKINLLIICAIISINLTGAPSSENDRSILLSSTNESKYAEIFNNKNALLNQLLNSSETDPTPLVK